MSSPRSVRTRGLAVVAAVSCAASLGVPASASATQPPPQPQAGATSRAVTAVQPDGPSWTITLVTGDAVKLTGRPGQQSARVIKDVAPVGDLTFAKVGQDVYAFPGAAIRMLAAGQIDRRLFNLSLLARDGFADKADTALPLIVSYQSDTAAVTAQKNKNLPGTSVGRHLKSVRGLTAEVSHAKASAFFDAVTDPAPAQSRAARGENAAVAPLTANPDVAKIWLDGRVRPTLDVSRVTVGADRAAKAGYDGTGARLAVLDTGVDASHPDLSGNIVDKQNFVGGDSQDVHDAFGHGTHVASIAAGSGAASAGKYTGIAPGAKLVIGKVIADDGLGEDSQIIAGMEWAASKAKVINMSLGGDPTDGTDPLSQALNDISRRTGALFVVSAGNRGANRPLPYTVTSPAAADEALAVSAVSRDGAAVASFSSVGPRLGDWAFKPEIAAPGLDITAARAEGNSLGTPVDDHYQKISGTSMAAPHVAGSAAILAARNPGWTAQQIKDALTSTAKPEDRDPIWWQGAGVVDVGSAVTQRVRSTGIVNLGIDAFPQKPGDTLSKDVTFTNDGDSPVTLDLSSQWWNTGRQHQGSPAAWNPPPGAVKVGPARVTVPAGGTATAKVTVDVGQAPFHATYGRLVATAADGTSVHTTMSFVRDIERHTLSLPANDRSGTPVTTTAFSWGLLQDLDTGAVYTVVWNQGRSIFFALDGRTDLPPGRYSFVGWIGEFGEAPVYPLRSYTMVAEPQIDLTQDREYVLDARKAGPLDMSAPRPTRQADAFSQFYRTGVGVPVNVFSDFPQVPNYLLASRTRATTGTFRFDRTVSLTAPPLTLTQGGRTMQAKYPRGLNCDRTIPAPCVPQFPARVNTSLVDVGNASQEELAQAAAKAGGLRGRYVLLRPTDTAHGRYGEEARIYYEGYAERLRAAGVAGVVVAPPYDAVVMGFQDQPNGPPTANLSVQDGRWLARQVANGNGRIGLKNVLPSPYRYNLWVTREGALPNGVVYRPKDRELGQVDARYHGDTPTEGHGVTVIPPLSGLIGFGGIPEIIPGRFQRPEFYTPRVPWPGLFVGSFHWDASDNSYDTAFQAGKVVRQEFGSGPWTPGDRRIAIGNGLDTGRFVRTVPRDGGQVLRVLTAPFNGPGPWSDLSRIPSHGLPFNYSADLRCVAGCSGTDDHRYGVDALEQQVPEDGVIKLTDDVWAVGGPSLPDWLQPPLLSTKTHTEWTLRVKVSPTKEREQPAPVLDWNVASGLDNVVPPDDYKVTITPGYSAYYTGDHGPFTVDLWATYDDGATWVKVGRTSKVATNEAAAIPVEYTPTRTNGFVGYRAVATDSAGNRIDQTVIRAARTSPATP